MSERGNDTAVKGGAPDMTERKDGHEVMDRLTKPESTNPANKYKNLLLNIGLFALNTVATKLIAFLLVPLYTYYMTSGEFGVTDMSTTVISLVMPLATLSISEATMRFALNDEEHNKSYITVGFLMVTLSCLIVLCCLPLLRLQIFGGLDHYQWFFFISYITNAFQMLLNNVARAVNEIKIIPVASVVTALSTGLCAWLLIGVIHGGVVGYFWSMIIGNVLGILFYIFGARLYRFVSSITFAQIKANLQVMLRYSLPLIPNALFWWAGTSINRFFITSMLGIAASGLFAVGTKIPTLLNLVCGIFQQAWTLSAFQEYKRTDISLFFTKIYRIFQSGMVLASSGIILITPWIAGFMLQKEFYTAWTLVPALLVAFYFNTQNAFYGTVYTSSMHTTTLFTTTICGALTIVAGTYFLIPPMGLMGACVAMALGNFIVLVLRMIFAKRLIVVQVHWVTVLPSVLLMIAQAVVMTTQPASYMLWSAVIFVAIAIIQAIDLTPTAKELYARMRQGRSQSA